MKAVERMERAFGSKLFQPAAFYAFEHALRFALAGDAAGTAPRFLRAMDRARAVAELAFRGSRSLSAVAIGADGEGRSRRRRAAMADLQELGFRAEFGPIEWPDDAGSSLRIADFAARMPDIEAVLWPCAAREMGVTPAAPWLGRVYLVDFDRRLALHVYDDRGMDVFAMSREPLQPLYDGFGPWLLDHDRALMDRRFGPVASG